MTKRKTWEWKAALSLENGYTAAEWDQWQANQALKLSRQTGKTQTKVFQLSLKKQTQ